MRTLFSVLCCLFVAAPPGNAAGPPNPTPSDAQGNTAGGKDALQFNAGLENTAFGMRALRLNTEGDTNTAVGAWTLVENTLGFGNTASGGNALTVNTTGAGNTAVGAYAMGQNARGNGNSAFGLGALSSNNGSYNTALGLDSLAGNETGNYNTASGWQALRFNIRGGGNVATGIQALRANTIGVANSATGAGTLLRSTGSYNTADGYQALVALVTGINNTALGSRAGSLLTSGSNNIYVGHPGVATESATLRLGNVQTRTFIKGVVGVPVRGGNTVVINSTGQLGVVLSSARYKQDIAPLATQESAKVHQLRPVTFHYKTESSGPVQYGLIAEEVAQVYPELVTRDAEGVIEGVRYEALTPILLKELQGQHQQIATQAPAAQTALQAQQLTTQDKSWRS